MKKINQVCLLIICSTLLFTQSKGETNKIPGDTSFTIWGTNAKVTKQFPSARLVKLQLPPEVVLQKDIIYREVSSRALHVDMFTPAKKKKQPSPAVLIIHDGGLSSGDKSMQYSQPLLNLQNRAMLP